jgi:hypothetical protein
MGKQEQDTSWGRLFLAPLSSVGWCIDIHCALNDPSGCSLEAGLVNNLPVLQHITLAFWDIILDAHINQKANATGWKTGSIQCAAALASGNETRSFKPKNTGSLEAPRQRLLRGDPRRSC